MVTWSPTRPMRVCERVDFFWPVTFLLRRLMRCFFCVQMGPNGVESFVALSNSELQLHGRQVCDASGPLGVRWQIGRHPQAHGLRHRVRKILKAAHLVLSKYASCGMGYVDALHLAKDTQFAPYLKTPLLQQTGLVGGELL